MSGAFKSVHLTLEVTDAGVIRRQILSLREEIALAVEKQNRISNSIDARRKRLSRLEAQYAMIGAPAPSLSPMKCG